MPLNRPRLPASMGWVLLLTILLLSGCLYPLNRTASPQDTLHPAAASQEPQQAEWFDVYFTRPDQDTGLRGGPDAQLVAAIEEAQLSIDVAAMQLDLWSIRDALRDAHRRGVQVRMTTDNQYIDEDEVRELIEAGIPVRGDRGDGLMHHKFVVIDRQQVWTGSMNLTVNGAYRNDNNLIRMRSSRLAEDYTVEFEEMFSDSRYGIASKADTPFPHLRVDGVELEAYFSPDEGAAARIVELIEEAQSHIYFLTFSFTSDEIAGAILERAAAGVEVAGIFEADQVDSNEGTEYERLRAAGLDVRLDGNPNQMHHKVFIIDGETVVTGSYNFSYNAETRNDENTLILHSEAVAGKYLAEFERIRSEAREDFQ